MKALLPRSLERLIAAVCIVLLFGIAASLVVMTSNRILTARQAEVTEAESVAALEKIKSEKLAKEEAEKKAKADKEAAEAEEAARKAEEEAKKEETPPTPVQPARPQNVSCNQSSSHNNPASIDVVVNKKNCLVPIDFVPGDLVTVHGATISAKASADFGRMFTDAAAAGQPFTVSSSYRSYNTQVSTYNYWVSISGQAEADTYSARPGFSEHQTGLVVDVGAGGCNLNCFGSTSQYQWFQANAANYGFIQRYHTGYEHITGYVSEEWHYRYVGVAVAQDMKAKGIKTLEQYWGIEGGNYR